MLLSLDCPEAIARALSVKAARGSPKPKSSRSGSFDDSHNKGLPESLGSYTPAQIKKLYYRSRNVNALAFLIALVAIAIPAAVTMLVILGRSESSPFNESWMLFYGVFCVAFYCFAAVGMVKRKSWGRILGIIICALSLIGFPLGTLIGTFGLFALIKGKVLFGPARVTHAEVEMAFKRLKSAGAF